MPRSTVREGSGSGSCDVASRISGHMKQMDRPTGGAVLQASPEPPPRRDPFRSLKALVRREGDVARYRAGTEQAYLVNHPDHVRHVLADNSANYSKDTFVNA